MCGIVGYIGKKDALPILIEGLKRELYRGYDSTGAVVIDGNNAYYVKAVGPIENLEKKLEGKVIKGKIGLAHCLPPDTLIQLADGKIKEISKITPDDKVLCLNPKTLKFCEGKIKVLKHKSPPYLYEIKTPSTRLITTDEHKMIVYQGNRFLAKKVKDLSQNDLLLFPKKIEITGKKIRFQKIFCKRYYRTSEELHRIFVEKLKKINLSKTKIASLTGASEGYLDHLLKNDRNFREDQLQRIISFLNINFDSGHLLPVNTTHGKFINLPEESSPEIMQILGYFLGDGTAQPKTVRFKDVDKTVLTRYQKLIEKVFGIKGRIAPQNKTIAYLLEVNSTFFSKWLKENIIKKKEEFLEKIGQLPREEIAAFLRGIFDAEGGVGVKAGQIFLGTTDEKLAKTIQFLLLRLDILSSISESKRKEKNWHKSYRISISNYNSIKNFLNYVGFSSPLKEKKARTILKEVKNYKRGGPRSFKVLPFSKKEIYEKCKNLIPKSVLLKFLGRGESLNYFISEESLISFVNFLKKESRANSKIKKIIDELQKFLNGDIVFQPIVEKRKIKSPYSYLYDLEVKPYPNFIANCLLSHNCRWATHGGVTEQNAHPHWDCTKNIFLVHNGIIENYKELKEKLIKDGHKFTSETDTEVLCHLIEKYFKGNLEEAVRLALKEVIGAYAIAVICEKDPEKIVFARYGSPLLIALGEGENFLASDAPAILAFTRKVIYLDDGEMGYITKDDVKIFDLNQVKKEKTSHLIEWTLEEAQKGGYEHFMLKEIMEEPEAIENALRGRVIESEGRAKLGGLERIEDKIKEIERLKIIGMGTALLAGKVGEYMIEEYAEIPVEAENASEFRYKKFLPQKGEAILAISQSGETADTLFAIKEAKKKRILTFGIVNVVGSSIAREVEAGIYNHAGPEISVAATKSFVSQLTVLALLTVFLGRQRNMSLVMGKRILEELKKLPNLARQILNQKEKIATLAKKYKDYKNFLFLGRKYNYPIALEGALKLKEISYLHAEGYPAGEMKHGPIALIDENFPTVAICPSDSVYEKMISNLEEIKARKGKIFAIATEENKEIEKLVDDVFFIPKTLEMLTPILSVIPLHLFAYFIAKELNRPIDTPRNLAKSVTVE